MRAYKVYAIKSGTVIDHIPSGKAFDTVAVLGLIDEKKGIVTAGSNLESKKHGLKDVVKIENRELTQEEVNKLALLAPKATINIIRNHKVHKKYTVTLPRVMEGFVTCSNPECVSNNEKITTKFSLVDKDPLTIRCTYCERLMHADEIIVR